MFTDKLPELLREFSKVAQVQICVKTKCSSVEKIKYSQVRKQIPVIPVLRRLRLEDCRIKFSLAYMNVKMYHDAAHLSSKIPHEVCVPTAAGS